MLPDRGSLMTGQNTPGSSTAVTTSWRSTGLTTQASRPARHSTPYLFPCRCRRRSLGQALQAHPAGRSWRRSRSRPGDGRGNIVCRVGTAAAGTGGLERPLAPGGEHRSGKVRGDCPTRARVPGQFARPRRSIVTPSTCAVGKETTRSSMRQLGSQDDDGSQGRVGRVRPTSCPRRRSGLRRTKIAEARHASLRIGLRHTHQIRTSLPDERALRDDRHLLPLAGVQHDSGPARSGGQV